jgi:hypothetical protein
MKPSNLSPLIVLIALAFMTVGCGDVGNGAAKVTPPASIPLPELTEANHNRFVGTYTATGTLPDGRAVRYDLYTRPDSKFSFFALVDGVRLASNVGNYDIRSGRITGGAGIALADGKTTVGPASAFTSLPFGASGALGIGVSRHDDLAKPPTSSTSYITFNRSSPAPLGDDRIVRVTDPSADCNADTKAERFEFLLTKYSIPYTKQGDFYAEGSLVQSKDSKKGFNFFLLGLDRTDPDQIVRVGGRVDLGTQNGRFSYFEYPGDGTIHRWIAVSGTLVFDAIDSSGADYSIGGIDYESDAGATFHLENVRMEAFNETGNTPFKGAIGSFTAKFSGTTTVGYKKVSR